MMSVSIVIAATMAGNPVLAAKSPWEGELAMLCMFDRRSAASKFEGTDSFAIFLERGITVGKITPQVVDPANVLSGENFVRLDSDDKYLTFSGGNQRNSQVALVLAQDLGKGARFAMLGQLNANKFKIGRSGTCAFLGREARKSFEYWRTHPEKIGETK